MRTPFPAAPLQATGQVQGTRRNWRWGVMLKVAILWLLSIGLSGSELCDCVARGDEPKAKKPPAPGINSLAPEARTTLEDAGFKVSSAGVSLASEVELIRQTRELPKQKKLLIAALREQQKLEQELLQLKAASARLQLQHVELSAQLGNVTDILANNRLVGALDSLEGQMNLARQRQEQLTEQLSKARGKASELRESLMTQLLSMRTAADAIEMEWTTLAGNTELAAAMEQLSTAIGKPVPLSGSAGFVAAEKLLRSFEETLISEVIPIDRRDGGLWVDVVFGKDKTVPMVVDSGATSISLPLSMATDLNLAPTSNDDPVEVGLADGRTVSGVRKVIPLVRVGKFEAENVDCIVLGAEAVNAPPLLGLSFLARFTFEIDADQGELRLVRFDGGDAPARTGGSRGKQQNN